MRSCQPLKMGRMLCVRVKARAHLASFEFYSFETHARLPPGACAGRGRAWRVQRRVRSCRTAPHCGRFAPRVVPLLLCFVWVTCVGQVYVLYGLNTLAPYPYECCSYCAPLPLSYHAARTAPHCLFPKHGLPACAPFIFYGKNFAGQHHKRHNLLPTDTSLVPMWLEVSNVHNLLVQ